jgi:hypothetical protein
MYLSSSEERKMKKIIRSKCVEAAENQPLKKYMLGVGGASRSFCHGPSGS